MAAVTGGQGTVRGKVPVILYEGTARMQIGYHAPEIRPGNNRVRYRGEEINYCGYGEAIAKGFHKAYEWFLRHEKEVSGRIAEMGDVLDSRYVSGNTQFFVMAVFASTHPDLMEKPDGRETYLKKICDGRKLAKWEAAAMADGDVPLFRRRLKDRNLYSRGEVAEQDFFDDEIEDAVQERFRQLCKEDCALQERILLISVEYFQKGTVKGAKKCFYIKRMLNMENKHAIMGWLEYAKGIAGQIQNRMICHKGKIFWLNAEGERVVCLKPMGIYLYSGLAGMAIFFRAIYQKCRLYGENCDQLEQMLFSYTDRVGCYEISAASEYPGMYCGEGSVAYAYQLLYQLTGQEKYRDYAERHSRILIRFIHQKKHFDILYGNAGAVLVLCRQYEMSGDPVWLDEVCCAMGQLEAGRIGKKAGVSWYEEADGNPVCGIAHGNSGMLLAYAKLYSLVSTDTCLQRMKEIVAYENRFVDERSGNWADMKKDGEKRYETYAWCNGGVGAVYARVLASMWNPGEVWLRKEAERGAALLEKLPVPRKMCLCHGNMGNWLVLRTAANYLMKQGELREKEKEFREMMERCMNLNSAVSEVGGDGFMNGNAGVGMGAISLYK